MLKLETPVVHKDMLSREVAIDDIVAYTQSNCLHIGKVTKLTAKRVQITRLGSYNWTSLQLPGTFIKLDDPAVTTWMLKGAKNKWDIMYGS